MIKNLLPFICFLIISSASAQDTTSIKKPDEKQEEENFWDRVYISGYPGLQFWDGIFYAELSPIIGYRVTDDFSAGIGLTYIYYRDKYLNYSTHIAGGRTFARYAVFKNFFLHGEYEVINRDVLIYQQGGYENVRLNVPGLYLGGGYRQMLGERSSFDMFILYNFLHSPDFSLTNSPIIIRTGINIGL